MLHFAIYSLQAYPFSLSHSHTHTHLSLSAVALALQFAAQLLLVFILSYTGGRRQAANTRRKRETYSNGLRIFIFDWHLIQPAAASAAAAAHKAAFYLLYNLFNRLFLFWFRVLFLLLFFFCFYSALFCSFLFCRRVSHSDAPSGRSLPQLVLSLTKRRQRRVAPRAALVSPLARRALSRALLLCHCLCC